MSRRRKTRKAVRQPRRPGWWASLDGERRRRIVRRSAALLMLPLFGVAGVVGLGKIEAHVEQQLLARAGPLTLVFLDVPDRLESLALDDLNGAAADLLARDWVDDRLCRDVAEGLAGVGWVAGVNFVRRTGDARLEVSASYRLPAAMVQQQAEFLLVDAEGVRLPGSYRYSPAWKLIQGVNAPAPSPGSTWAGRDLRAGLDIIAALGGEPFSQQVTGILVENSEGRIDARLSHVELATDRAGGRIRWGSAPGLEIEENTVEQKLAILRENYRRTGRIDALHAVIDVSTYPDRFTIPG